MNKHHTICSCHRCTFLGALHVGAGAPVTAPVQIGRDKLLPDSPAACAAEAFLATVSNVVMMRHCIRTYRFGQILAEKAGARLDLEVFYVASLLHDLGLETLFSGLEDFETLGARAAKRFLVEQGYEHLAEPVAAAIEIHTAVETANDARPEVAYLSMGAYCDVTGARLDQIEPRLIQQIVDEYPRKGTKDLLTALVRNQIETKPQSRIANVAARADVLGFIRNAPFAA